MYDGYPLPMTDILLNRLIQDLGADKKATRRDACITLLHYRDKKVVSRLIKELKNSDAAIRGTAAYILGRMGSLLAENELQALLDDKNTDVRMSACNALGDVGGIESVRALAKLLDDEVLGKHARESIEKIRERYPEQKEKMNVEDSRLYSLTKEDIIRDRKEFMRKADEVFERMQQFKRKDPPEKKAAMKERKHVI